MAVPWEVDYFELVRPDEADELEPLILRPYDPTDQQTYLS